MTDGASPVTIRDIDIPFLRIVVILIKWILAAIPAAIVAAIVYSILVALLGGLIMGLLEMVGNVPNPTPTP